MDDPCERYVVQVRTLNTLLSLNHYGKFLIFCLLNGPRLSNMLRLPSFRSFSPIIFLFLVSTLRSCPHWSTLGDHWQVSLHLVRGSEVSLSFSYANEENPASDASSIPLPPKIEIARGVLRTHPPLSVKRVLSVSVIDHLISHLKTIPVRSYGQGVPW